MGIIENGMNLMRISDMVLDLFKKEKEEFKKAITEIEFSTVVKKSYNHKSYLETKS
jgi:hypothetical protein